MEFFDVNIQIGYAAIYQYGQAVTINELFHLLEGINITRAVVWHAAERDAGADVGNALTSMAVSGDERALGCWSVVPPLTDYEVRGESAAGFFNRMHAERIVALRAFPDVHHYQLSRTTFGSFLDAVSEHHIPLLMSLRFGLNWTVMQLLMREYPELTLILCDLGHWGQDRESWPLLQQYPNVYLESSLLSLEAGGLEAAVETFGAERIIFGSDFPWFSYPYCLGTIMGAEMTDEDRRNILYRNGRRILESNT